MFNPFYSFIMLAFEAQKVIELRLVRLAWGGSEAQAELSSMVSEKINASIEAAGTMMSGGSPETVIPRYREHVEANTQRLTSGQLDPALLVVMTAPGSRLGGRPWSAPTRRDDPQRHRDGRPAMTSSETAAFPARRVAIILGLVLLADGLEIAQFWIDGRQARAIDFFASAGGALIGAQAVHLLIDRWIAP